MKGFVGETEAEGMAVVQAGGDKAVNKDGSGIGLREGRRRLMLRR